MYDAWRHVAYAARVLAKARVATGFTIVSLALGIGANTAFFSLWNILLLRTLAVADPWQLAAISTLTPDDRYPEKPPSLAIFTELRRTNEIFSSLFAWSGDYKMANFQVNGVNYASTLCDVSGDYFATLNVRPFLGRLITADDVRVESATPAAVAVLDYRCWRNRYQGDPAIVGKSIRVEGRALTIIGVTPESFTGLLVEVAPEATVPLGLFRAKDLLSRKTAHVAIMGRLKSGVTLQQAQSRLEAIWPAIRNAAMPDEYNGEQRAGFLRERLRVQSAATGISFLRESRSRPLAMMMGLVGLILLLVCVNLANLMVAQARARRQEFAVRLALGAGKWQIIRQLLLESITLSLAGGALGIPLALWAARALIDLTWSGYVPTTLHPALDVRVAGFTLAAAMVASVFFGLAPAVGIFRDTLAMAARENTRTAHGGAWLLARLLLCGQVALSLLLVCGAALLVRTLNNLRSADVGFHRGNMLLAQLFPQAGAGRAINLAAYYQQLSGKIAGLPGVESVSYSRGAPFTLYEQKERVSAAGSRDAPVECTVEFVGPAFFQVMGMRLRAGRDFDWRDREGSARVVIVSESLARRLFPEQNAVGRRINVGVPPEGSSMEIAGVAPSASLWSARVREPLALYVPLLQEPGQANPMIAIRTIPHHAAPAIAVRSAIESLGRNYALRIEAIEERENSVLAQERMTGTVSAFLAGLALLLAATGIYGLTSYAVTRRTSEIGLRVALGARPGDVVRLILRETGMLVLAGLAVGVPAALGAFRLARGMLYGISENDPVSIVVSSAILAGISICAAYFPARRAGKADPLSALRGE